MKWVIWLICVLSAVVSIGCTKSQFGVSSHPKTPGERLFRSSCQNCHTLPNPASRPVEQWPKLVEHYGSKIKLTPDEQKLIVNYLQGERSKSQ
ncbi:MAG: hypothetical protein OEM52_08825 [bacterium]|nr:hypothetical protein [bacterium]